MFHRSASLCFFFFRVFSNMITIGLLFLFSFCFRFSVQFFFSLFPSIFFLLHIFIYMRTMSIVLYRAAIHNLLIFMCKSHEYLLLKYTLDSVFFGQLSIMLHLNFYLKNVYFGQSSSKASFFFLLKQQKKKMNFYVS